MKIATFLIDSGQWHSFFVPPYIYCTCEIRINWEEENAADGKYVMDLIVCSGIGWNQQTMSWWERFMDWV